MAPQAARLRYLQVMRSEMESRQLLWMHWELAASFGLYDPAAKDMIDVLFGPRGTKFGSQ